MLFGYGLTGLTIEQALYFLHGPGANGKSTLLDLMLMAAGEYGATTPAQTLLSGNRAAIRNDLARLHGVRMVSAIEVNKHRQMDEALTKQVTGGDVVTSRFLQKELFEHRPQYTILIAANHLPCIQGQDDGIWRRIRVIPARAKVSKEELNPHLKEQLQDELPGILAWMVKGAKKYLKSGLPECAAVEKATKTFRATSNHVAEFVADCLIKDAQAPSQPLPLVFNRYKEWTADNGFDPLKKQDLSQALLSYGFEQSHSNSTRTWKGFRLKVAADFLSPSSPAAPATENPEPQEETEDNPLQRPWGIPRLPSHRDQGLVVHRPALSINILTSKEIYRVLQYTPKCWSRRSSRRQAT